MRLHEKNSCHRCVPLLSAVLLLTVLSVLGAAGGDSEPTPVGIGPFSRMSMTLIKSVLFVPVDVLDLEVHFGLETAERLQVLVDGQDFNPPLANSIAEIATQSQDASVRLRFLRNISLNSFIKGARSNTKKVYEADLITRDTYEEISRALPVLYFHLKERGIKKDDLMLYRIRGDSFRTIYRGFDGTVYLDQQNSGEQNRLALLGGYFVSKSEFREHLIQSLFMPTQGFSNDHTR